MTEFKPPIGTRTTEELLKIVGAVNKWNNEAVEQARIELQKRKVSTNQIAHATYLSNREDELEALKRAKESYTIADFIFHPARTILEILISWELKKDGYLRKAEQQKYLRVVFVIIILIIIWMS